MLNCLLSSLLFSPFSSLLNEMLRRPFSPLGAIFILFFAVASKVNTKIPRMRTRVMPRRTRTDGRHKGSRSNGLRSIVVVVARLLDAAV